MRARAVLLLAGSILLGCGGGQVPSAADGGRETGGARSDGGGASCGPAGSACEHSSECCSSRCGEEGAPSQCEPSPAQGACRSTADCDDLPCTGGACCIEPRGAGCYAMSDCCGGVVCTSSGVVAGYCCNQTGVACMAGGSCCSGTCSGGTCTCAGTGAPCGQSSDCCSGMCAGNGLCTTLGDASAAVPSSHCIGDAGIGEASLQACRTCSAQACASELVAAQGCSGGVALCVDMCSCLDEACLGGCEGNAAASCMQLLTSLDSCLGSKCDCDTQTLFAE